MNRPDVIVWVDPGLWTGIAAWYPNTRAYSCAELEFSGVGASLSMLTGIGMSVWIGWERFNITMQTVRMTQYEPHALEVIGMCRWIALNNSWRILPAQLPRERLMVRDDMLRKLDMHPGRQRDDDALSASKHLVTFLMKSRMLPPDMVEILKT